MSQDNQQIIATAIENIQKQLDEVQKQLDLLRARSFGGGGGISQEQGDSRYVNVVGDTMTGPLTLSEVSNTLTLDPNDPTATQPSIHFKNAADKADIWSDGDTINFGDISTYSIPFYITGSTNTCAFPGYFGSNISFDSDSLWEIGQTLTRPAIIYTDSLNVGNGGITAPAIAFRTDDQCDIGTAAAQPRNIWIDGIGYIDQLNVEVALNCEAIDVVAAVGGNQTVKIPVTVNGTTMYIPCYES